MGATTRRTTLSTTTIITISRASAHDHERHGRNYPPGDARFVAGGGSSCVQLPCGPG